MATIIIDGYNLLATSGHQDRDQLIRHLSEYQQKKGHQITIVFDGTHGGTRDGDCFHSGGVEVIFSPLTVTADETMEEMLERTEASGWIVVSSDRRVQSAAFRAGADAIPSSDFAIRLQSERREAITSEMPPWLEGRTEEDERPSPKKGSPRKPSKQERKKKKGLKRL